MTSLNENLNYVGVTPLQTKFEKYVQFGSHYEHKAEGVTRTALRITRQ